MLIHDAARPNFSIRLIKKIINNSKNNSVIPKINIHDALKQNIGNKIIVNIPRENFFLTQTPQSFKFVTIFNLHAKNKFFYKDDDFSLAQSLKNIKLIQGEKNNFKITHFNDLSIFKNYMKQKLK